MYLIIICFISFLFPSKIFKGKVLDEEGYPIKNVNISLINNGIGTSTDENGYFILDNFESNTYDLEVSHIGFMKQSIEIKYPEDNNIFIILVKDIIEYERVVVTGTRVERNIKDSPVLTNVISSQDINYSTYASVKGILEMTMPNVQSVNSNHVSDRMKIQGLDNKYMLFLIDGDRVSGEFAGNLDFNMLNLKNVKKIEMVEGGMSALYGSSAVAGIINIITKKQEEKYWFDFTHLYDSPMVISTSTSTGFNYKNLFYSFTYVDNKSNGYNLNPEDGEEIIIKTLEEFQNISIGHNMIYQINPNYSLEFSYKNYSSEIYKYRIKDHQFCTIDTGDPSCPSPGEIVIINDTIYITSESGLPRYYNNKYGLKFIIEKDNYNFKIIYNNEEYLKKNYYFDYENNIEDFYEDSTIDLIEAEFLNAKQTSDNFLIQYDFSLEKHNILFGLEYMRDNYFSYNIFKITGDIGNDGMCDLPPQNYYSDCKVQSIFNGIDDSEYFQTKSLFVSDQWIISNKKELGVSARYIDSNNFDNSLVSSLSYLMRVPHNYNIRFNYSKGFKIPSLKELYYNWEGHSPAIYGNANLKATENHYYSVSFDKRTYINDFSLAFYYNDIKNMVGTKYFKEDSGRLDYVNFNHAYLHGFNCHYSRKITDDIDIKFVYNYTNPKSNENEVLELINKHSLRINYIQSIIKNKLTLMVNTKYSSEKFNFSQEEQYSEDYDDDSQAQPIKVLEPYSITDIIFMSKIKDFVQIKWGIKNIFDYKDPSRLDNGYNDILNNYDPGQRFVVELSLLFNQKN